MPGIWATELEKFPDDSMCNSAKQRFTKDAIYVASRLLLYVNAELEKKTENATIAVKRQVPIILQVTTGRLNSSPFAENQDIYLACIE